MNALPLAIGLLTLLALLYWLLTGTKRTQLKTLATVTDLYIQPGQPLLIPQPEGPGRIFDNDKRLVRLKLHTDGTVCITRVDADLFRNLNIGNVVTAEYIQTPFGKKVTRIRL